MYSNDTQHVPIGKWSRRCKLLTKWDALPNAAVQVTESQKTGCLNEGAPPCCYGISSANRKLVVGSAVQDGFSCAKISNANNRQHCLRGVYKRSPQVASSTGAKLLGCLLTSCAHVFMHSPACLGQPPTYPDNIIIILVG